MNANNISYKVLGDVYHVSHVIMSQPHSQAPSELSIFHAKARRGPGNKANNFYTVLVLRVSV